MVAQLCTSCQRSISWFRGEGVLERLYVWLSTTPGEAKAGSLVSSVVKLSPGQVIWLLTVSTASEALLGLSSQSDCVGLREIL